MDKAARKKLNLRAIKRYDAAIVNILDQSPHAVLYHFSNERREWVKKSVEGVLFLVQRNAPPYFAVYIMNRLAMENYTLYLTDFDDMELQENFIIYSTSDGERYAFWLYEEGDRQRLLNKINTLHDGIQKELSAKTNKKKTNPPPPPATTSSSGNAAMDLLSMLKTGALPAPPPPPPLSTSRHHPPNEYGPERSEPMMMHARMPWTAKDNVDFSLPDADLMQPQHDPSGSHRLLELLKPQQEPPTGENRLLDLLKRATVDDTNYMPSPPLPPASLGYPHPSGSSSTPNSAPPHILFGKELTKAYTPPMIQPSPSRNSLLQALQGGKINGSPIASSSSSLAAFHGSPSLVAELDRRLPPRALSKPEFIQQFYNILQNDPSFFDVLYDHYKQHKLSGDM